MSCILTVVVPTYNMESYLHECLKSLIYPGNPPLEVIVVNDGSSDKSLMIAKDYQRKYPSIFKIIDKSNGNYGSCINAALKIAAGKFIKVLDADDWFDVVELERYLKKLAVVEVDLVLTDYTKVNDRNHRCSEYKWHLLENRLYGTQLMQTYAFKHIDMHSVTYRTSLLKQIGYNQTEGISYTDQEWIFYPMTEVRTIRYVNTNLYHYRLGREGQSMELKNAGKFVHDHILFLKRMLREYSNYKWDTIPVGVHDYLHFILLVNIRKVYKSALLPLSPIISSDCLSDFDAYIQKTNGIIYEKLNDIVIHSLLPYKFIRHYHRHRKCPSWGIRFLNNLMKIIQSQFVI